MATWTTPKTNWRGTSAEDGTYTGDYFSYVDFNRIRNNLDYLTDLAGQLYVLRLTGDLPSTKVVTDYPYADEINLLEKRLHEINAQSIKRSIGTQKTFYDNGAFIDADELNRIESATLTLNRILTEQAGGRKMLRFRLGLPSGSIRF